MRGDVAVGAFLSVLTVSGGQIAGSSVTSSVSVLGHRAAATIRQLTVYCRLLVRWCCSGRAKRAPPTPSLRGRRPSARRRHLPEWTGLPANLGHRVAGRFAPLSLSPRKASRSESIAVGRPVASGRGRSNRCRDCRRSSVRPAGAENRSSRCGVCAAEWPRSYCI